MFLTALAKCFPVNSINFLVGILPRTILHIDMDAFFAAIEALDNPSLKGKPVIVGGSTDRGVVSTASYEARKFGIHSAMPIFTAKKKCPHGIFLPVKMRRYKEVSGKIMDILKDFTPLIEQVSIDEAYLDITGTQNLLGSPAEVAKHIKEQIHKKTGLTCSVGVAPNRFLAKVASDTCKPGGVTIIQEGDVDIFLSGLPIEKIPGVGKKALENLRHYGIKKVTDLKRFKRERLLKDFGKFGIRLYNLAKGVDGSPVVPGRETKSISSEETLPSDTKDLGVLVRKIKFHSENVACRLRKEMLKGRTVRLKIKFDDFSEISRSCAIGHYTQSGKIISDFATTLFKNLHIKRKVRLIGVAIFNLIEMKKDAQMQLFGEGPAREKERSTDKALDEIRERFGKEMIKKGSELSGRN
jgi:DNA polymerase-4